MANAYRDENNVATLIASSSVDGKTPVRIYGDPTTHRLLVDFASGLTEIDPTSGAVNGINQAFVFPAQPTYAVVDGIWYKATDNNGNTQWTWTAGTSTLTFTNLVPQNSLFAF